MIIEEVDPVGRLRCRPHKRLPRGARIRADAADQQKSSRAALGEPRKPSEKVAEEACADLTAHDESGAPFTPHMADQLLLPAALADGRSEIRTSRITQHLLTNAHVIREFLPVTIDVAGSEGEPGVITIGG